MVYSYIYFKKVRQHKSINAGIILPHDCVPQLWRVFQVIGSGILLAEFFEEFENNGPWIIVASNLICIYIYIYIYRVIYVLTMYIYVCTFFTCSSLHLYNPDSKQSVRLLRWKVEDEEGKITAINNNLSAQIIWALFS